MGYHDASLAKLHKFRKDLTDHRRIQHHIVIDTGQFLYPERNGSLGVYKGTEPISNFPFNYFYCTDLNDPVLFRGKSRCLKVKHHKLLLDVLSLGVCCNLFQIIYKIRFHPIDYFKTSITRHGMVCIRKGLHCSVVFNGDGLMAPTHGTLDDVLHIRNAIHITHFRMAMELHPLLSIRINTFFPEISNFFNATDISYGQLAVKTVNGGDTIQHQKSSGFYGSGKLLSLILACKKLNPDRICKIRYVKYKQDFFISQFTLFHRKNLSPYDHAADLSRDRFNGNDFAIKITSIEDIWII